MLALYEKKKVSPNPSKKKPHLGFAILAIGSAAANGRGLCPLFGKRKGFLVLFLKEIYLGGRQINGRFGGNKREREMLALYEKKKVSPNPSKKKPHLRFAILAIGWSAANELLSDSKYDRMNTQTQAAEVVNFVATTRRW